MYISFGGYSWDCLPGGPVGWVVAVPINQSAGDYSYHLPTTEEGDFWAPEGVSIDSLGNVYVVSGDSYNNSFDYGNSVIKLASNLSFDNSNASYFSPANWNYTNANDLDLGSTGATLLPGNLVFSIGKDGIGYLLNASNLGGIAGQLYNATVCGVNGAWGVTSYYNGVIYVPCGNSLDALRLNLSPGSTPAFSSLWNYSGFWSGPPIIAYGAVWAVSISNYTFFALNPINGSLLFQTTLNPVEHFTTPSAGGGLTYIASNETVYGINP